MDKQVLVQLKEEDVSNLIMLVNSIESAHVVRIHELEDGTTDTEETGTQKVEMREGYDDR